MGWLNEVIYRMLEDDNQHHINREVASGVSQTRMVSIVWVAVCGWIDLAQVNGELNMDVFNH